MADGLDFFQQRVGTTLRGKWKLERLIAVGGMAAVYVAVHKIGRRDAVKILRPEAAKSRELVERFEQEAHAVNHFRHPGVVEVRDVDRDEDGVPFLVMELLEGESLVDAAQLRPPPLDEALRYLDEVLDVLVASHAQGIIHRDVKPDNLFVTREGRVKVLDFGFARMLEGSPRQYQTAAGLVIGTPEYMSPEQVLGHPSDARADLYAVGATFFWLLARRHVHQGQTDIEVMIKATTQPAPPLCSVAPHVPPSVGLVIDRALTIQPDDRFPDAQTMQQDVRALRRGEAPPYASLVQEAASRRAPSTAIGAAVAASPVLAAAGRSPPPGAPPGRPPRPGSGPPPALARRSSAPPGLARTPSVPPAGLGRTPSAPPARPSAHPLVAPPPGGATGEPRPLTTLPLNFAAPSRAELAAAAAAAIAENAPSPGPFVAASAPSPGPFAAGAPAPSPGPFAAGGAVPTPPPAALPAMPTIGLRGPSDAPLPGSPVVSGLPSGADLAFGASAGGPLPGHGPGGAPRGHAGEVDAGARKAAVNPFSVTEPGSAGLLRAHGAPTPPPAAVAPSPAAGADVAPESVPDFARPRRPGRAAALAALALVALGLLAGTAWLLRDQLGLGPAAAPTGGPSDPPPPSASDPGAPAVRSAPTSSAAPRPTVPAGKTPLPGGGKPEKKKGT
jgi:serine/threonine-protein kinase